jgi:glutamate-1-semialdehyde aminotransferase
LFGHQQPFIISAITEQLAQGMQLGPHSPLAGEVARRICDMTGQQRALFCNTGSEAVMVAVRLARAVTGRRRIALFAGAYHGSADPILARQDIERGSGESVPMAPGITSDISRNALVLPYGAEDSLDVLRAHQDELAAVLVEPVQSRQPDLQPVEFLRQLRELTRAADIALIFDEIVTGFRVHPGGVRALFGLSADITTYGKVLGGGLPIGVVAGDVRYLNAIDGGAWRFDETRQPQSVRTFFTGTFAKHPLALAAARAVLDELERRGPSLQEELSARTLSLVRRLSAALESAGIRARVGQFGSLFRFSFPNEPPLSRAVELFYTALLEKGLYIWEGRNCFLSTAHTDTDLDAIVTAVARTAAEMVAAGFSFGADRAAPDRAARVRAVTTTAAGEYPVSRVQHEMWLQDQLGRGRSRAYTEAVLLDLRGELDHDVLRLVMAEVLARHDSLHAVITADGSRQRIVLPEADLPLVDMTGAADGMRQRTAWLEARARDVFDLTARPPVRAAVLRLVADHHQLYLGVHHAMIDGWSFDVLLSEISELYNSRITGRGAALAEPVQYREHVAWERQREESPAWDADLRYWQEQFPDGVPELVLPADRPRSTAAGHRLGTFEREIGMDVPGGLPGASSRLRVTPFTALLAAYAYLLHQVSGQDDLIVGVPFARRGYPGGERVVGNCSVTLPVRSRLPSRTQVREYIRAIHATMVEAHQHPDFSVGALRERTRVGDGTGGHIFAASFNMDRATALPRMRGLTVDVAAAPKRFASGDLSFDVLVVDGSFRLTVKYDADLFDRATADRYADLFDHVLRQFVADPDTPLDQVGLAPAPTLAPQVPMAQDEVEAALRVLPV